MSNQIADDLAKMLEVVGRLAPYSRAAAKVRDVPIIRTVALDALYYAPKSDCNLEPFIAVPRSEEWDRLSDQDIRTFVVARLVREGA